jgi:Spy/CpxP family protein refolding chaperone
MAGDVTRSRVGGWALALLLLAVGAAAGAAVDRLVVGRGRPPGPPMPDEMTARLTRDLDLTEAQAGGVREIVEARWSALGKLFERIDPEAEAIRQAADDRIRALLDPEQRARFDARVAEHAQRRAEMRRRLGRAPPPPP